MRALWCLLILLLPVPVGAAELLPVRLGVVIPLAGEAGRVGQSIRRAAEMSVADWGPRLGRRIELLVKGDTFDPRHAAVTAAELVRERVRGVVGHFYSSSSIAASVVYAEAGIPLVTATSTHPRLTTQGFAQVFRVCGRDERQAPVAADFLWTRLQVRRVAVLHDRTEYGRGLADTFRRHWVTHPAGRLVAEGSLAQGDTDFHRQVIRLKEGRPDAVYFGGVYREAALFVRQLRQASWFGVFVGGDALVDPDFVVLAGEAAATGAYLTSAPDPHQMESARALVGRYESRYGPMGPHVVPTYDAVGVLLHAMRVALPADDSKQELRRVTEAIRATPYDGALGTLRWDKNGDVTPAPYAVYTVRRGGTVQGWFEQVSRFAAPDTDTASQRR